MENWHFILERFRVVGIGVVIGEIVAKSVDDDDDEFGKFRRL